MQAACGFVYIGVFPTEGLMNSTFLTWSLAASAALLLTCVSGCTIPYTTALHSQLNEIDAEVARVQFYNSKAIKLEREVGSSETEVSNGKITVRAGKHIQVVFIRLLTPGVCQDEGEGVGGAPCLGVAFEPGDNRELVFCPDARGVFKLGWQYEDKNQYLTQYDGDWFQVTTEPFAELHVRKKDFYKLLREVRFVRGLRVD
jgi:hypothetical protein